jgi:hypothetical protein
MSSNFNCSYMTMSSLTYILGFSVKFFFQPIYTDYTNWTYFDKRSHLNLPLWNRWTKLKQIWLEWSLGGTPFNIVSDTSALHSKWLLLLKIYISLVVNCALLQIKMNSNFNCSYIAMSGLTCILGFSEISFQPVYSI